MPRFPQKWIDAIQDFAEEDPNTWTKEGLLEALASVGALKDPPKPRELWVCIDCKGIWDRNDYSSNHYSSCKAKTNSTNILFREVIEE